MAFQQAELEELDLPGRQGELEPEQKMESLESIQIWILSLQWCVLVIAFGRGMRKCRFVPY